MSHQDLRRPGLPGYDLRFEHSATAVIYATGFVPRARRVPDLADRIGPGDPRSRSARHRLLDPSSVCAAHRIASLIFDGSSGGPDRPDRGCAVPLTRRRGGDRTCSMKPDKSPPRTFFDKTWCSP